MRREFSKEQTLIVFGSRTYADRAQIFMDLRQAFECGYRLLVHGACESGADAIADGIWSGWGLQVEPHPADWEKYDLRAGPIRNREMAELGAGAAIGYRSPGKSKGTDGMRRELARLGIPTLLRGEGWGRA